MNKRPEFQHSAQATARVFAVFLLLSAVFCRGALTNLTYDARGNLTSISGVSAGAPTIIAGPANFVCSTGRMASFTVTAAGAPPLSYQWYFGAGPRAGATNDSLAIAPVGAADFGSYYVVVTNFSGATTSAVAQLLLDSDGDGLPDSWEIAYFGSITNQNALMDKDGDGTSNLQEFLDGTNPTNRASVLPRLTLRVFGGDIVVSPAMDSYPLNTTVTLTAVPDPGNSFIGWCGDLTGNTNPTSLVMNSNKMVMATFGLPLNAALDITNAITIGGDGGWYGQTNDTHDGLAARTAPMIGHPFSYSSSFIKTTVTLARDGTVSFWYRTDTVVDNELFFLIDNGVNFPALRTFAGTSVWTQKTSYLSAGTHTLTWTFQSADQSSSQARGNLVTPQDAAYLDHVVITEYANTNLDTDGDGLGDLWEYKYFDTLNYGAHDDPDGDGVDNITEYQDGTIPTSGSSVFPRLAYVVEGSGSVAPSPNLPRYNYNQTVTNIASPNSGWNFVTWRGPFITQAASSNTNNPSTMQLVTSQTVKGIFGLPLAQVTDVTGQTWNRGGEVGWYGETNISHDGVSAAQSGPVGSTSQSWMETTFAGPGTLVFWWKVDSTTNFDLLRLLINSNATGLVISGVTDWQPQTILLGSGPQTVRWQFIRNGGADPNRLAAGWVDQIQYFTGPTPPQWVQQPASQTLLQISNAVLQVLASGTPPIYYQLFHGASPFGSPGTNTTLTITNPASSLSGTWTVQATNTAGISNSLPFTLSILPVPPTNDNFANRIALTTLSNAVPGYNFSATKEAGEPNHGGYSGGASVWWAFTAPLTGKYRAVAEATNVPNDLLLGVYSGTTVSGLTTLGGASGSSTTTNSVNLEHVETFFDAVASSSYPIAIDTTFAAGEFFALWVERIPPPVNDLFANRTVLTGSSASGTSQNISATAEPGEPAHLGLPATNSIWWTWTPPFSGPAVVSTLGSDITPRVAVYTNNSLPALVAVASGFSGGGSGETIVNFNAVSGMAYQIAVDTFFTAGGHIQLNVALTKPTIANVAVSGTNMTFSVLGPVNSSYVIEESVDLKTWVPFVTNTIPLSGAASFQEPVQTDLRSRFYRARVN